MNCINWLPAKFRCEYNTATSAYRIFDSTLPSYLSASLCTYQTVHSHLTFQLRSAHIRQYTPTLPFSFALHVSDSTLPPYLSALLCTYQTVHSHLTFQRRSARIRQYTPTLPFSVALHISDSTLPPYLSASLCTYRTSRTLPS